MSGTQPRPALSSYRDAVLEQIEAGESFGEVEDSIDEPAQQQSGRQGRQRELGGALAAALKLREPPGTATARTADRPRPLEFDGNGFPIAQRMPSVVTRVARLLSSS